MASRENTRDRARRVTYNALLGTQPHDRVAPRPRFRVRTRLAFELAPGPHHHAFEPRNRGRAPHPRADGATGDPGRDRDAAPVLSPARALGNRGRDAPAHAATPAHRRGRGRVV